MSVRHKTVAYASISVLKHFDWVFIWCLTNSHVRNTKANMFWIYDIDCFDIDICHWHWCWIFCQKPAHKNCFKQCNIIHAKLSCVFQRNCEPSLYTFLPQLSILLHLTSASVCFSCLSGRHCSGWGGSAVVQSGQNSRFGPENRLHFQSHKCR